MYEMLQATGVEYWSGLIDTINLKGYKIISCVEKNTTLYVIVQKPFAELEVKTVNRPIIEEVFNLPDEAFLTEEKPKRQKKVNKDVL